MEKSVLCFGDSLTWGLDPSTGGRFPYRQRWTGIAQEILGPDYRLIEEGLPGRTTVYDDPFSEHRNGKTVLPVLLESHAPLDLVVLFLGINDLQIQRPVTGREVALGLISLQQKVVTSRSGPTFEKPPACLIVSPPTAPRPVGLMDVLFRGRDEEASQIAAELEVASKTLPFHWIDAAKNVSADGVDGVHLTEHSNYRLGTMIAKKIREILAS